MLPVTTTSGLADDIEPSNRMNLTHCPICHTELEVIGVAPCWDCGHKRRELEDLATGQHTYSEYRVFGELLIGKSCGLVLSPRLGIHRSRVNGLLQKTGVVVSY
jgi:hypothetical protein